ncbi:MAG TPA: hypothetical protein VG944_21300 [Fimbriimonas sp.]|nr:hypothetical protein [Fimbriimonas sp.]
MERNQIDERTVKLLREIAEMSEHAVLTGSLEGGSVRAAKRYNAIVQALTNQGQIAPGLFSPIDENSNFGEIAVEARLLASYIDENGNGNGDFHAEHGRHGHGHRWKDKGDSNILMRLAPFLDKDALAELVKEHAMQDGRFDGHLITALAPFLDGSTLSDLVRNHLLSRERPEQPSRPEPPPPSAAPVPAPTPVVAAGIVPHEDRTPPLSLDELAAKLREGNLTDDERQQIAIRLAELSHEEAKRI